MRLARHVPLPLDRMVGRSGRHHATALVVAPFALPLPPPLGSCVLVGTGVGMTHVAVARGALTVRGVLVGHGVFVARAAMLGRGVLVGHGVLTGRGVANCGRGVGVAIS